MYTTNLVEEERSRCTSFFSFVLSLLVVPLDLGVCTVQSVLITLLQRHRGLQPEDSAMRSLLVCGQ